MEHSGTHNLVAVCQQNDNGGSCWNRLEKPFEMLVPDMERKLKLHLALQGQQLCALNKHIMWEWNAGYRNACGSLSQPFPGGLPPWKQLTLMSGVGIWPEDEKAAAEPT